MTPVLLFLTLACLQGASARSISLSRMCPNNEPISDYADWTRIIFSDGHNNFRCIVDGTQDEHLSRACTCQAGEVCYVCTPADVYGPSPSEVAMGQAKNGSSGLLLPDAGNMRAMQYTCDFEKDALKYARLCTLTPTVDPKYEANVFITKKGTLDKDFAAKEAMNAWKMELELYGLPKNLTFTDQMAKDDKVTSATKQGIPPKTTAVMMIWAGAYSVGCAVETCNGTYNTVVCVYQKRVNNAGKLIYKHTKKMCNSCPKGTSCDDYNGLCYKDY